MTDLQIEQWPIDRLTPYARNPRKNDDAVPKMAGLIKEFGFKVPIVARSDGEVIDGHLRLKAARHLGLETVPVVLADEWTAAQVKAFRLAVNKSAEWAEWDEELLKLELDDLKLEDFDLELIGFEDVVLDDESPEGLTDPDAVPEEQEAVVSREGDIWILGNHRLMCGDSTDAASVALLMNGEKADMVFTSPPYNADAEVIVGRFGKTVNVNMYEKKGKDAKTSEEYIKFVQKVFSNCLDVTKGMIYWNVNYNANSRYEYIAQIMPFLDLLVDQVCWKKHLTITNTCGGYTRIWEPIYVFTTLDKPLKLKETVNNFWEIDNVGATVGGHHACFPVALPLKAIDLYGEQIKTVFEPFCGSGSTLIACEQKSVVCRGMELEPRFCDVTIRRWQDFTGREAVHESGKTFSDVAAERGV